MAKTIKKAEGVSARAFHDFITDSMKKICDSVEGQCTKAEYNEEKKELTLYYVNGAIYKITIAQIEDDTN